MRRIFKIQRLDKSHNSQNDKLCIPRCFVHTLSRSNKRKNGKAIHECIIKIKGKDEVYHSFTSDRAESQPAYNVAQVHNRLSCLRNVAISTYDLLL